MMLRNKKILFCIYLLLCCFLESAVCVEIWITIVAILGVLLENWAPLCCKSGPACYAKKNAFI